MTNTTTNYTGYKGQARAFLRKAGARMSITYVKQVKGFPFSTRDRYMHDVYEVRIDRAGKSYRFPFYQSAHGTDIGERPDAYDVLACLEKDCYCTDAWDFADEYGYTINSRAEFDRVNRIYNACKKQAEKLHRLFGEELMDDLREIC